MDLKKQMYGKIIKGTLNGEKVAEQWINVNNAVLIAEQYADWKVSQVDKPVIRKRANCVGCKHLSKLSGGGYRYCLHKNRGDEVGKIDNVNTTQIFCPITV